MATSSEQLSPSEKARIERNRQSALLLRQERIKQKHQKRRIDPKARKVISVEGTKLIDSGSGFFISEEDLKAEETKKPKITETPASVLPPDKPICEECDEDFGESFLFTKFDHPVCDNCRDSDEKHVLVTKTEAKKEYLLKDIDFDRREPPLKYIVRPNPHNSRWGDMKLYLLLQVEKRALEVWGSLEKIEEQMEKREQNRENVKRKKFDKRLKALRMQVRSTLYKKKEHEVHEHVFGEEEYDEEEDEYCKKCVQCGHTQTYEKM